MLLGYYFGAADGDLDFYDGAPEDLFCPVCRSVLDKTYLPASLKLSRKARSMDIFATYDGKRLISERAAVFFRHHFADSCKITKLNVEDETPIYILESIISVEYDFVRRKTEFINLCKLCGNYEAIIGATPAFLKSHPPLAHGLYRTDIEFGSNNAKHPLLFLGVGDDKLIKSFKPHGRGLDLEKIVS